MMCWQHFCSSLPRCLLCLHCMGWQHWCSTICEGSCYTLHRRGPVMLSKAWKDKSRYHWNGVQNKLYLFSKAPYEVSTGRTEYRFIKSLSSGVWLRWQKIISFTFATNLCPLTGKNFSAAWRLFIDILGSSPQGESWRTKVPFGFRDCFIVPSLCDIHWFW